MNVLPVLKIMSSSEAHERAAYAAKFTAGAAYVIDHFCPIGLAAVPITDTGFLHADAAYDVVTASRGYIFRLDDHLDRFERSCEIFQLQSPFARNEIADILIELVQLTGFKDAYIFWCVTRGDFPAGPNKTNPTAYQNRFFAFAVMYRSMSDDAMRSRGIDIMVSQNYVRIPANSVNPRAKNFHWMDMKQSMFEAGAEGYDWAVLTNGDGYLTEAPGCNVFAIHGDVLSTPDTGCLEGITRECVFELAQELSLSTEVRPVHVDELRNADEAFVCSSAGGIMPVNSVDRIAIGGASGRGNVSIRLHNLYWEKRWSGWNGTTIEYQQQ